MKSKNSLTKRDSWLIFVIGLFLFTIWLRPEFLNFQTRFALFAQTMFHTGLTFFPQTYLGSYPDYTAASTIVIYGVSRLFGQVTPFSAILPTAIVSSLSLVVTYRIAALHNRQWGIYAVLFLLLTQGFIQNARDISLDQYITLITILCLYLSHSAFIYHHTKRLWFLPILFAIGFVFRGPIGLVIPTTIILGYYLSNGNWKLFFIVGITGLVLLILLSMGLLFAAKQQNNADFVNQVIAMQVGSRLTGSHSLGAYSFYWLKSSYYYALSYPVALLVIGTRFKSIFKKQTLNFQLLRNLTIGILLVLIGMSIPGNRKLRYILALAPLFSIIAAYLFVDPSIKGFLYQSKKLLLRILLVFPYILLLLNILALCFMKKFHINIYVDISFAIFLLITLIYITHNSKQPIVILSAALLTLFILNIFIFDAVSYQSEKTQPFTQQVARLAPRPIVFYFIGPDAEDIKFMVNFNRPVQLHFIQEWAPNQLFSYQKPVYFIALQENFDRIPKQITKHFNVILTGKIGHRDCVVFTKK
ncbi:MAG: glycosyltransferase family 39 protein [Pseudomonadota bacterium]